MTNKVAVVILSEMEDSHADLGRVVNGLQVASEFKEAGDEVAVIFDGGGVVSGVQIADPEHRLHKLYQTLADDIGLCRYCSRAFEVYEEAEALELPFLSEYKQHPSLRSRVEDGYQVMTF